MLFNFLTQGCERLFIFYILTFCIQKFNSLKLAPEPPEGEQDGKRWWEWWEVRAAQAMMGGDGRAWEGVGVVWEGVGVVGAVGGRGR